MTEQLRQGHWIMCLNLTSAKKIKTRQTTGNVKGVLAAMFLLVTLPSQLALIAGF